MQEKNKEAEIVGITHVKGANISCQRNLLMLDLGARTISPSKCLTKYARENKET